MLPLQVIRSLNIGYSQYYLVSDLSVYHSGAHDIIVGFDLVKGNSKYDQPHFIKLFWKVYCFSLKRLFIVNGLLKSLNRKEIINLPAEHTVILT